MADPFIPLRINSTHVSYDGHTTFNESLLNEFNYTIYSNGTLSNDDRCFLAFDAYKPVLLSNGTVLNGTKCDSPIDPIETRGALGIVSAALCAVLVVTCLVCLRKHGLSHLPVGKQFRLVSRRWPWYWAVFTAAVGCISGFMAIDVDRDYLPGTAIILQSVFYYSMIPTCLAAVWEMTRHWGNFEERKIVDDDPYLLKIDDRRSKIEFYIPLVFYLFVFLTFFLSILRTWTPFTKQHFPGTTDARFRASSIFAVAALIVTIFSCLVTRHYYRSPIPWKIPTAIGLLFIRLIFNIACLFGPWSINPGNIFVHPGWLYGLGYAPVILVLVVMCIGGWGEPNEDLELISLRREKTFREEVELGHKRREETKVEARRRKDKEARTRLGIKDVDLEEVDVKKMHVDG